MYYIKEEVGNMDIIVDKRTGYIVNPETLTMGENLDILNIFRNVDGKIVIPSHVEVIEIKEIRSDPDKPYHYKHYYYVNGKVECRYVMSTDLVEKEIDRLKNELSDSDYMVIKSYEATMAGLPVEYNMTEIHFSRQTIRDKINELEFLMQKDVKKMFGA